MANGYALNANCGKGSDLAPNPLHAEVDHTPLMRFRPVLTP